VAGLVLHDDVDDDELGVGLEDGGLPAGRRRCDGRGRDGLGGSTGSGEQDSQ
jgi:hypothetical protein